MLLGEEAIHFERARSSFSGGFEELPLHLEMSSHLEGALTALSGHLKGGSYFTQR